MAPQLAEDLWELNVWVVCACFHMMLAVAAIGGVRGPAVAGSRLHASP